MKPLVIYHANCADGFGAAFAAWLKLGDDAEYVPMQYGNKVDLLEDYSVDNREVYILDFSFPRDTMDKLFAACKRVVWLDHHKTAFEMWCKTEREHHVSLYPLPNDHVIVLDNSKSGAVIAWEHFHFYTPVPMMIRHIDDYDRWQFKIEGTKEFNKALWSGTPWNFRQWEELLASDLLPMYKAGKAILRAHEQNVQSVVKGAGRQCFIPHVGCPVGSERDIEYAEMGLAANCPPHLASDVGHALANESGTFGLLWYINKDGKCLCSLRSNGDYDVSAIAKAFGGGGHKNAAGFSTDIHTLLGWIE